MIGNQQRYAARFHGLVLRIAVVARLMQRSVKIDPLDLFPGRMHRIERFFQRVGTFPQRTFIRCKACYGSFRFLICGFPSLPRREDRGKVPKEAGIHILSVFQFHGFLHCFNALPHSNLGRFLLRGLRCGKLALRFPGLHGFFLLRGFLGLRLCGFFRLRGLWFGFAQPGRSLKARARIKI